MTRMLLLRLEAYKVAVNREGSDEICRKSTFRSSSSRVAVLNRDFGRGCMNSSSIIKRLFSSFPTTTCLVNFY